MTLIEMGPSLAVEAATTRVISEAYVERVLSPTLRPGQIVVMENVTAHKGERVRKLIEDRGRLLLYPRPTPRTSILSKRPSRRLSELCLEWRHADRRP
jgi:hypothetical protein